MRISDWSSDVCSSDLAATTAEALNEIDLGLWSGRNFDALAADKDWALWNTARAHARPPGGEAMIEVQAREIGRASCRERVCQYVSISVVAGLLKKQTQTYYM